MRWSNSFFPFFGLLALGSIHVFVPPCAAASDTTADRIARVEHTLRPPVTLEGDEGWSLEERMEHYGVPGLAVAVIQDFEVDWFKVYGEADRETGEPVTATTLFQAGSISKPVAAFGAMKLVQEGKLSLDENVNEKLKGWKIPDNEFTEEQQVTLTRLLSHTAGLTVHGFPGYAVGEAVPTTVQVLDGIGPANTDPVRVDFVPGSRWRYSGGGYTVVQKMMTDVADASFPELMRTSVLAPIGMGHSTYENPLPPEELKHAAAGYLPDHSAVEGKRHTYPEMAAAGLWTTAEDLARFGIEVQLALHGRSEVLSREMAMAMVEPVRPAFGRGFVLSRQDGAPYFSHGGWDEGFCAHLLAHQRSGYGIALMINANHPELMEEIVRAVAQEYGWAGYRTYLTRDLPEAVTRRYVGRYRYNAEQAFTLYTEGDRMFLRYVGSAPEEMFYIGEDKFIRRERTTRITFTEDDGEVRLQFVFDAGRIQSHEKLADDVKQPRELLFSGPYDQALAAYRAVLSSNPDEGAVSESYLNGEGYAVLETGTVEQAILLLRIATDLYPSSANAWDSLGEAYRRAGDREHAIESYRQALKRDPAFPSAVRALAELEVEGD